MGNSSSQVEQERWEKSTAPLPTDEQVDEDENADATSAAGSNGTSGTNKTSASRALARDLERSVMQSSQDHLREEPPLKRRNRKSTRSHVTAADEVPDTKTLLVEASVPPSDAAHSPPDRSKGGDGNDREDLISQGNASGSDSVRKDSADARKHLVRDLRRLKKTVLVNSGKAKWAPKINGAKWEVEKLPPGQWLDRELTKAEQQTLAKCREKVKDAKRRLQEFDRGGEYTDASGVGGGKEPIPEDELASAGDKGTPKAGPGKAIEASSSDEESGGEAIHDVEITLSPKERKRQQRAQRKSEKNAKVKAQAEMEEQIELPEPAPELEPEPERMTRPQKKRKRLEQQNMPSSPPRPMIRSVAGKHKTDLVKTWLNSQDPPETMENAAEQDDEERPELRKRRSVSMNQEDDDDEYQAASQDDVQTADSDDELPTFKPVTNLAVKAGSTKDSSKSTQVKKIARSEGSQAVPMLQSLTKSTGPFTAEEKSVADSIFNHVLQSEGIDEATLKQKMCSWRSLGIFKDEIEGALPARDKTSIRKFCQRRYHMLERGAWTAEQDDDLRNAQANYPGQWKKHEELIGRTAADCKDRWTLQLQHSKATGAWTLDEEAALVTAVERAINTIKNDKATDPALAADRGALVSALSWKLIAKDLGNKRNHKQCREKWDNLQRRDERELAKTTGELGDFPHEMKATKLSKTRSARRAVRKFEIGDFYDVFVEIHTSFEDPAARYHDEDKIVWSIVAKKNPASRFNLVYHSGHLRRAALNHALQEWKIDSKKVRRRLEKSETLPAKAKVLAKLLEKSYAGRLHAMSRMFMLEMVGKTVDEILQFKAERKRTRVEKARRKKTARVEARSQQFVEDTDEEEAEEANAYPVTPPADDEEEEESDDSRGEEEQSVCQRRLNGQINGREADVEDEAQPGLVLRSIEAPSRNRRRRPSSNSPDIEYEDSIVKKEQSEIESESEHLSQYPPPDPNNEVDAEMLRRFDAAINGSTPPAPAVGNSFDDDDDSDEEMHENDADDLDSRSAVSLKSAETPVIGRADFVKICREQQM